MDRASPDAATDRSSTPQISWDAQTGKVVGVPTFTILDAGRPTEVAATTTNSSIWIAAGDLERALGWELKPEGLCQGDVCIPLSRHGDVVRDGAIELGALAALLGRPLAVSVEAGAAYLGPPHDQYEETVRSLLAPDFTLPDLDGRPHSLSASW